MGTILEVIQQLEGTKVTREQLEVISNLNLSIEIVN